MSTVNPSIGAIVNCDVLIVGAGFSGISALHGARKLGLTATVFESGTDFGGVWYWNRYPGARVDSEYPFYQLNIAKAYHSFDFDERFPDDREIRKYFAHLDKTLDLRKDVQFEAHVNDARYDEKEGKWTVKTAAGHIATSKYLILATGLLHRRHYPDFPGLKNYKGVVHHSGFWPEDFSCKGKKVAVVGAGATSVQIVQELAKETADGGSLTMFMRRPSTCLPMAQRKLSALEQKEWKSYYAALFRQGRSSSSGFPTKGPDCGVHDVPEEERVALFEELWSRGGMAYLWGNYNDLLVDFKANRTIYDFWAKKVRARMTDPVKKDLMAPLEPAYPFGTKRCPLEQDYYECLDMGHVDIVDLNKTPLKSFTEKGILTEEGVEREFDVVVLATGFDSFTGSLTNMGLKNKDGVDIKDCWKDGVRTYLGMLMSGFPNAFIVFNAHGPTALSNGPTTIECQMDFIMDVIKQMEIEKAKSIEPLTSAEDEWKIKINSMNEGTLFPFTSSWWTGGNIPGKKAEWLTFTGGIENYEAICREKLNGWKGFKVVGAE